MKWSAGALTESRARGAVPLLRSFTSAKHGHIMLPVAIAAGAAAATIGDVLPPLAALLAAHGARLFDGRALGASHLRLGASLEGKPLSTPLGNTQLRVQMCKVRAMGGRVVLIPRPRANFEF
jgi:hypothetical protein